MDEGNFLMIVILVGMFCWFFGYLVAHQQYTGAFEDSCQIMKFSDNDRIYRVISWHPETGCFKEEEQTLAYNSFLEKIIEKSSD